MQQQRQQQSSSSGSSRRSSVTSVATDELRPRGYRRVFRAARDYVESNIDEFNSERQRGAVANLAEASGLVRNYLDEYANDPMRRFTEYARYDDMRRMGMIPNDTDLTLGSAIAANAMRFGRIEQERERRYNNDVRLWQENRRIMEENYWRSVRQNRQAQVARQRAVADDGPSTIGTIATALSNGVRWGFGATVGNLARQIMDRPQQPVQRRPVMTQVRRPAPPPARPPSPPDDNAPRMRADGLPVGFRRRRRGSMEMLMDENDETGLVNRVNPYEDVPRLLRQRPRPRPRNP